MAQILTASIYGANGNDWNTPQGVTMGFPVQQSVIRTLNQPTSFSGVTCLSQIQLLPTAPSPIQPVYYSPTAAATLITAANA
jgi:hypothetical protein